MVPTGTCWLLFVLVVLTQERRKVVHFNITEAPTAEWTAQQVINAFPYDGAPKYFCGTGIPFTGRPFADGSRGWESGRNASPVAITLFPKRSYSGSCSFFVRGRCPRASPACQLCNFCHPQRGAIPAEVLVDGQPMPRVDDLESKDEDWSVGPLSLVLVRVKSGDKPRKIELRTSQQQHDRAGTFSPGRSRTGVMPWLLKFYYREAA